MSSKKVLTKIESSFRKTVQKDPKVKNAYLLIHSDKHDIHLKLAEGSTDGIQANPAQPNYMASVGKLFTATIIGKLYEKGKLKFTDSISEHLNAELIAGLHIYKGKDYTDQIKIKDLLSQRSGLPDAFWPLLDKLLAEPDFNISPEEAIIWSKENMEPSFEPGKKFEYTDTNYYLLGLIIEEITGEPFAEALNNYFFEPLEMKNSHMLGYSKPAKEPEYPMANFYKDGIKFNDFKNYSRIDYAGGGVVAPMEDLLKFMKALVNNQLINAETLEIMKEDTSKFGMGIDYGYGIWKIKTIPVFMPKKLNSWGVVGVTGAFMFYHPLTDSYIIGNFNDASYESKGVRFMLLKVLKELAKLK